MNKEIWITLSKMAQVIPSLRRVARKSFVFSFDSSRLEQLSMVLNQR
jgi:hypothetical protein